VTWIDERRVNRLKVTAMLSRSRSPVGHPTALSVPHDALRIRGPGRAIEPAAAVTGSAPAKPTSAAKAYPDRRRTGTSCVDHNAAGT
jgi:hypothetical protein